MAGGEDAFDRVLDRARLLVEVRRVSQQHGYGGDRADRVGDVLSGQIGSGSVNRLVEVDVAADRGGGEHAERSAECRRLVGEDIAEQILCNDHVEAAGIGHEVRRAGVDV